MVDPAGPGTRAGVPRDSWSPGRHSEPGPGNRESWLTPWDLRHGPWSPGTASRPHGTSDLGTSCRGQLVDPRSLRPWPNPQALGNGHESSRTAGQPGGEHEPGPESSRAAGRPCGPSDPGPKGPGQLVDTVGLGPGPRSAGRAGRHRRPSHPGPSHPGQLVNTSSPPTRAQITRDSWLILSPSDSGPGRKGELVKHEGPRARARVARDSWWTPQALGPDRE